MAEKGPTNDVSAHNFGTARRVLSALMGAVSALLLVVMLAVTTIDVIGRYFFNAPVLGAFEVSEVAMALVIYAGLPLICMEGGNVQVTLLTERLGAGGRRIQRVATDLVSAGVLAVLAWRLGEQAARLLSYGDASMFLSIPMGPVAAAMAVFSALAALILFVNALAAAVGRQGAGSS